MIKRPRLYMSEDGREGKSALQPIALGRLYAQPERIESMLMSDMPQLEISFLTEDIVPFKLQRS